MRNDDYINLLKLKITESRKDKAKIEERIMTLDEMLTEYETFLDTKEELKDIIK